jgi:Domain of unknown function (DUF4381)
MEAEPSSSLELKPPPPPDALLPRPGFPLLGSVLISLGVLLLIIVVLKWRKARQSSDPTTLRRHAYEAALRSLNDATAANSREAATVSSLVLRRYLATVSGDPALFETHEEFVTRHDSLRALPEETRQAAVAGLDRLASLKYSMDARAEETASVFDASRSLLETFNRSFA